MEFLKLNLFQLYQSPRQKLNKEKKIKNEYVCTKINKYYYNNIKREVKGMA